MVYRLTRKLIDPEVYTWICNVLPLGKKLLPKLIYRKISHEHTHLRVMLVELSTENSVTLQYYTWYMCFNIAELTAYRECIDKSLHMVTVSRTNYVKQPISRTIKMTRFTGTIMPSGFWSYQHFSIQSGLPAFVNMFLERFPFIWCIASQAIRWKFCNYFFLFVG